MAGQSPAGPDGAVHAFPVSVKGVAVQDGKVLLLENERAEWELPGGKLELGEDPAGCVAREISEESGWKVITGPLLDCWQYHIRPGVDVLIVTYGCQVLSSEPPVASAEHKRAGLFTAAQVPGLNMPDGYKRSIAAWFARDGGQGLTRLGAVMADLCDHCGAPGSPSGRAAASCPACQPPAAPTALVAAATWLPAQGDPGPVRRLGDVLRSYRKANGLFQQDVADMVGYDRTYISMIESGRRNVTDRGTLAYIARTLAIPPHLLGITDPDNASYKAMLEFGASVVRLADLARGSGRPADAVSELWPLITRLEARITAEHADLEVMRLLTLARVSFGVALGHLLPEERVATAARWTGRALRIAWDLGDTGLLASVLRMHGNELRKAGHSAAAIIRLRQSLELETDPTAARNAGGRHCPGRNTAPAPPGPAHHPDHRSTRRPAGPRQPPRTGNRSAGTAQTATVGGTPRPRRASLKTPGQHTQPGGRPRGLPLRRCDVLWAVRVIRHDRALNLPPGRDLKPPAQDRERSGLVRGS